MPIKVEDHLWTLLRDARNLLDKSNPNPLLFAHAFGHLEGGVASVVRAMTEERDEPGPQPTANNWRERCETCEKRMRSVAAALRQIADGQGDIASCRDAILAVASELVEWGD